MTVTDPDPACAPSGPTDGDRVAEALRTQQSFSRTQVAWLMSQAMHWGYELGYAEGQHDEQSLAMVAAAYAHTGSFSAEVTERSIERRNRRRESDAAARLPRPDDHRGGPVPMWDDNEMQVAA